MVRLLLLFAVLLVAGCSSSGGTSATGGGPLTFQLAGLVRSGRDVPLAGARVRVFRAGAGAPELVGEAFSNASGRFVIATNSPLAAATYYATATLDGGVVLAAVLGNPPVGFVVINEMTTVAAGYSMARLYRGGDVSGSTRALIHATAMAGNLADVGTGEPSPVMLQGPNADQTNGLRSLRSLANLLALCVRDPGNCATLFALTTVPGLPAPGDTWEALVNLAHLPGQNVEGVYDLSRQSSAFTPALAAMPDAWTLAVKVNDSGDDNHLIGGVANTIFRDDGTVWITNNSIQGTTVSTTAGVIVLQADGRPAPISPLTSGGLLGPGFGITEDPLNRIWVGNFGWGGVNPMPDGNGSMSLFLPDGTPLSPPNAFQGGPVRVQAAVSDPDGNIWMASFGTDEVWVFPGGDVDAGFSFPYPAGSGPFGVALAADGTAWIACATAAPGLVSHLQIVGTSLQELHRTRVGLETKGLAIDSLGNVWVPSAVTDSVFMLSPEGQVVGEFTGGAMDGPWSLSIDGADNVWVSNFGDTQPGSVFDSRITLLAGANDATRPPGLALGDPITPADTGYTLPSAGEPVLLHNGVPLYGPGSEPAFTPMMRLTSVTPDPAGNLWAANNWKPDFTIDFNSNPGGDGMVIFVGVSEPVER